MILLLTREYQLCLATFSEDLYRTVRSEYRHKRLRVDDRMRGGRKKGTGGVARGIRVGMRFGEDEIVRPVGLDLVVNQIQIGVMPADVFKRDNVPS